MSPSYGRLEATTLQGWTCIYYNISLGRVQTILDKEFGDRLYGATYYPHPRSMRPASYHDRSTPCTPLFDKL